MPIPFPSSRLDAVVRAGRRTLLCGLLPLGTVQAAGTPAEEPAPRPWAGYLDDATYGTRVGTWPTVAPGLVEIETYGTSREGRPLLAAVLSSDAEKADTRPAVLVVAGLDALHPAGSEMAVRLTESLLRNHAEILDEVTILVLPRANPDGMAALFDGVNTGRRGGARRVDADRDGLLDEDPPTDLNGDGVITMMRLADPSLAHPPTHLADPGEPRIMRTPDRSAGERATHAMFVEGIDHDGDGMIGEDGLGEVRIDRNFMHLFREHDHRSGTHPLSEPEALALAEFVLARPNIVGAVVLGPHDTAIRMPDTKEKDVTGRTPRGIDPGDEAMHRLLQESWLEHTGQARSATEEDDGGLHAWLYAHRGIPTLATTGWGRPDPAGSGEESEDADAGEPTADAEMLGWLAWSDREADGAGFVPWTAFEHPQLGPVEIGGMVPGFTANPPVESLDELAAGQADFVADLASMRPRVVVEGPEIEDLGGGVARIRLVVRNDGSLPLRTAMGRTNRAIRPLRVGIPLDRTRIMRGRPNVLIEDLPADGGRRAIEWVVRRPIEAWEIVLDDPQSGRSILPVPAAGKEGGR